MGVRLRDTNKINIKPQRGCWRNTIRTFISRGWPVMQVASMTSTAMPTIAVRFSLSPPNQIWTAISSPTNTQ